MEPAVKKISKKDARKLIYNKLAMALAEYKDIVKEKRFASNLKKASKLFAADIARASGKLNGKPKKKKKAAIASIDKQQNTHAGE